MQRLFFVFLLMSTFSGCSFWSWLSNDPTAHLQLDDYEYISSEDYSEHLLHVGRTSVSPKKIKHIALSAKSKRYLTGIYKKIVENNEVIFKQYIRPKFYVLDMNKPIYFSLPKAHFYFSKGFFKKFVKHEGILASVLARESIRSLKSIYRVNQIIPIESIALSRVLLMLQLDLDVSNELNKWSYHLLKRTQFREINYLLWLQTKNKNMIDFSYQSRSIKTFAREEQLFKSFLISEGYEQGLAEDIGNSSRNFYLFLEEVRKI